MSKEMADAIQASLDEWNEAEAVHRAENDNVLLDFDEPSSDNPGVDPDDLRLVQNRVAELTDELTADREQRQTETESRALEEAIDHISKSTSASREVVRRQLLAEFMTSEPFESLFNSRHENQGAYQNSLDDIAEQLPKKSNPQSLAVAVRMSRGSHTATTGFSTVSDLGKMSDQEFHEYKSRVFDASASGELSSESSSGGHFTTAVK